MSRIVEGVDLEGDLTGFEYHVKDGLARIVLNRPDAANSLNDAMAQEIFAIWADVRDNNDIVAAIVTAAGERHFSTGADVSGLTTKPLSTQSRVRGGLQNRPMSDAVFWSPHQNRVWKPVICGVNGLACGAGLHFIVDADIVVASRNAKFLDTHVNVGQVGALENIGLAKRLPLGTALRMTLQGKSYRLTAERAYQLGFVDELVDEPSQVAGMCEEIASDLLGNSVAAMMASKEAMWKSLELGYSAAIEYGWALLRNHWGHPDFVEGPKAFGEKRAPQWNNDPSARRET